MEPMDLLAKTYGDGSRMQPSKSGKRSMRGLQSLNR